MKNSFKATLLLSLFFLWVGHGRSKGLPYEDIPLLVEKNNELVKSEERKTKSFKARLGHLKRSFIPTFETYAGQEKFSSDALGDHSSFFYGISGELNLYNASKDKLEERKRKKSFEASKIRTKMTEQELIYQARTLYLSLAALKAMRKTYQLAMKRVLELEGQVEKKVSAGIISESDLTSLELLKGRYRERLHHLNRKVQSNSKKLSLLLGKERIGMDDINAGILTRSKSFSQSDLQLLEYRVQKKREEIYGLQAQQKSNEVIPRFDVFIDYGRLPFSERELSDSSDREEWRTGVKVSWDMAKIWESRSLKAKAESEVKAAEYRKTYAKKEAENRFSSLGQRKRSLRDSIGSIDKQISRGREYFAQIRDEYLRGVKSTTDLNAALNQLLEWQQNRIRRQQEYQLTVAQMAKFQGNR